MAVRARAFCMVAAACVAIGLQLLMRSLFSDGRLRAGRCCTCTGWPAAAVGGDAEAPTSLLNASLCANRLAQSRWYSDEK